MNTIQPRCQTKGGGDKWPRDRGKSIIPSSQRATLGVRRSTRRKGLTTTASSSSSSQIQMRCTFLSRRINDIGISARRGGVNERRLSWTTIARKEMVVAVVVMAIVWGRGKSGAEIISNKRNPIIILFIFLWHIHTSIDGCLFV